MSQQQYDSEDQLKDWIRKNGCQSIFRQMKDVKILPKSSSSDSVIVFGTFILKTIGELDVVLKIVFEPLNPLNNSLTVENQIYENIVTNLLDNDYTPHLIKYIATVPTCDLAYSDLDNNVRKKLDFRINDIHHTKFDKSMAIITVLTRAKGKTMLEFLKNSPGEGEVIVLLFQLLYTLLCFENKRMVHNDLHPGNIFVEKEPVATVSNYVLKNRNISVKTNLSAKIYDFDRGACYHPAISRNLTVDIEFCEYFNQCNYPGSNADLQAVVSTMFLMNKKLKFKRLDKWISEVTSKEFRDKISKRTEYLHIIPQGEIVTDRDISDIPTCIDKLYDLAKNTPVFNLAKNTPYNNIYVLPDFVKIDTSNPVSIKTHVSASQVSGPDHRLTKQEYNDLLIDEAQLIFDLNDVWHNELRKLGYNNNDAGYWLMSQFLLIKPVQKKWYPSYAMACYFLSLPFWSRFSRRVKKALIPEVFIGANPHPVRDAENDVWTVFGNRLPIKVPNI